MDVLGHILDNIPLFTNDIFKQHKEDSIEYVFDNYIKKCININFDSKTFYLTRNTSERGFEINTDMTHGFLKMMTTLIKTRCMNENIKNSSNRIHFRVYKDNVLLDSKKNEIRKALAISLVNKLGTDSVLKYIIDKRCDLLNLRFKLDSDTDEWCENEVFIYRCDIIIGSIQEHKSQISQF